MQATKVFREALALEQDLRLRERAAHDVERCREPRVALVHRNAKSAKLERAESRPDPDRHSAFAQVIDPADLLATTRLCASSRKPSA